MLHPNYIFDSRYNLLTLLGKGGFSEVWLAEDNMAKVQVAIKIYYSPEHELDDEGIEMFRKEFAMVSDMNHTNLLRPAYYGCWKRMPYLVLPYCEEGTLEHIVNSRTKVSEADIWRILRDVAGGLAYLHSHKPPVVHQDIKPGNIMIGTDGENKCYMISDFGISAKIRQTTLTSSNTMASGTIAYMGPERFEENSVPDKAGDIWSLGASLCELMTGKLPFGESGGKAQRAGVHMAGISSEYSSRLVQIVCKCLDPNPANRPEARMLAEEADRYVTGRRQYRTLNMIFISIVIASLMIFGASVFWNRIKEKKRIALEQMEIMKNDSLSVLSIKKAWSLIGEGDAMLEISIDKHFEESYLNALDEIKLIESSFGDKLSISTKERRAEVEKVIIQKIASAKDTLIRKSFDVEEIGNEFLNAFIEGLNNRIDNIGSQMNNDLWL